MSSFIDIFVTIDTVTLLASYPNPSKDYLKPTPIAHNFGYMVAQSKFVQTGQATGDLSIKALVGDVVRWRTLSLSGNADQSAVIYSIEQFAGKKVTGDVGAVLAEPYEPVPIIVSGHHTNPPTYNVGTDNDYYLQASITGHGTENYLIKFYVTTIDQTTGKPILYGYYYWDPAINVP